MGCHGYTTQRGAHRVTHGATQPQHARTITKAKSERRHSSLRDDESRTKIAAFYIFIDTYVSHVKLKKKKKNLLFPWKTGQLK